MKKKMILIIVILITFTSSVGAFEIAEDKKLHFVGGSVIYAVNEEMGVFNNSFTPVVLAGVGKELMDSQEEGNKFDLKDLAYTLFGGFVVQIGF